MFTTGAQAPEERGRLRGGESAQRQAGSEQQQPRGRRAEGDQNLRESTEHTRTPPRFTADLLPWWKMTFFGGWDDHSQAASFKMETRFEDLLDIFDLKSLTDIYTRYPGVDAETWRDGSEKDEAKWHPGRKPLEMFLFDLAVKNNIDYFFIAPAVYSKPPLDPVVFRKFEEAVGREYLVTSAQAAVDRAKRRYDRLPSSDEWRPEFLRKVKDAEERLNRAKERHRYWTQQIEHQRPIVEEEERKQEERRQIRAQQQSTQGQSRGGRG